MRVQYTTTTFSRPTISRQNYEELKVILIRNPQTDIEPPSQTISQRFSGHMSMFKYCGIGLLIGAIGTGIFGEPSVFVAVSGISMLGLFFTGIHFLFESPSYATFKKKKAAFFEELKTAILNTSSYEQFDLIFNRRR